MNRFRKVQVDSLTGHRHSRQRFEVEASWLRAELAGKWVLDGECGVERFAEVAAESGCRLVALDRSSAIGAAAEMVARFSSVELVQGNLLEPPFREGAFDYAYSSGVAQHTADPPRVVGDVVRCVRPGGEFCFSI